MLKALIQCLKKQNQLVLNEETFESKTIDELTFGVTDTITKKIEELVHKIRCAVGIIGEVIGEGELRNVFEDFKNEIKAFLITDIQQCIQTEGLTGKLKQVDFTIFYLI